MIDNLLDLSRLEDNQAPARLREPVDLNELVHIIISNHQARADTSGIKLELNLDESLPRVPGDRNQLIQTLTNLVGNALAYTPEGGHVWIRSEVQSTPEGNIAIIIVEDTGVGISPRRKRTHL